MYSIWSSSDTWTLSIRTWFIIHQQSCFRMFISSNDYSLYCQMETSGSRHGYGYGCDPLGRSYIRCTEVIHHTLLLIITLIIRCHPQCNILLCWYYPDQCCIRVFISRELCCLYDGNEPCGVLITGKYAHMHSLLIFSLIKISISSSWGKIKLFSFVLFSKITLPLTVFPHSAGYK